MKKSAQFGYVYEDQEYALPRRIQGGGGGREGGGPEKPGQARRCQERPYAARKVQERPGEATEGEEEKPRQPKGQDGPGNPRKYPTLQKSNKLRFYKKMIEEHKGKKLVVDLEIWGAYEHVCEKMCEKQCEHM